LGVNAGSGFVGIYDGPSGSNVCLMSTVSTSNGDAGGLWTRNRNIPQNNLVYVTTFANSNNQQGAVGVYDANVGGINAPAGMAGDGSVWAQPGKKNFVADHPTQPELVIVYATLEGPEAGMYVRGTAQLDHGMAEIELPDHFAMLASERGMTAT